MRGFLISLKIVCAVFSFAPALPASEFFVAPGGLASGDGSIENPWDLRTALRHPTNVVGGDTIWLRGGVYRRNDEPTIFVSLLNGEIFNPIIVRQYPGERAVIDGNISQSVGGWVHYWGFEIMNSHSNRLTTESGSFPTNFTVVRGTKAHDLCVSGFDLRAPDVKLINLVVHDSIGGGIGINTNASNSELSGVISFYNGWQGCDRAHGHGYYGQNRDPSFAFVFNSLFFANYALGMQATGSEGLVDNFFWADNTLFFNSVLARKRQGALLIGPASGKANNPALYRNLTYNTHRSDSDINIGYAGGADNPMLFENYFQTSVHFSTSNQNLYAYGNTFLGGTDLLEPANYPGNDFSTNRPNNNFVVIQPNIYEPGRAHIVVYNWEGLTEVAVDTVGLLSEGTEFEVRSAQDLLGAPVVSGVYTSGFLMLPMTNLRVAKPIGTNAPPSTAPEFNVFILRAREVSPMTGLTNSAPALSPIEDQFTQANVPTDPIPFTFSDAETPSDFLAISVHSTRPDLVSNPNIRFAGSGTNRSITIVPTPGQSGVTTLTLAVSDGFLAVSNVFSVTVAPSNPLAGDAANQSAVLTIESDNTVLLRMAGPPETEYEVQSSTNLATWQEMGTIITDCTGMGFLHDEFPSNSPARFYRFEILAHDNAEITDPTHPTGSLNGKTSKSLP